MAGSVDHEKTGNGNLKFQLLEQLSAKSLHRLNWDNGCTNSLRDKTGLPFHHGRSPNSVEKCGLTMVHMANKNNTDMTQFFHICIKMWVLLNFPMFTASV